MGKQTKVLLSIAGVLAVAAVVLASSNSEMFQGRAGRDVGRNSRSTTTTESPSTTAGVVLKLDSSANVLSGSHARLLALVSKGYKVMITKDINLPTQLIFECADIRTGVDTGGYKQKYFTCESKNVDGKLYEVEYTDNNGNANNGAYLVSVIVGEKTTSGLVSFKDLTFSVEPTSILATINGGDGSLSSTSGMSVFDTTLLKLTSVPSQGGPVESFYCDLDVINDGNNYSCNHPSFWISGGNVNYIKHTFDYINSNGGIHYKDTDYSTGDITAKSKYDLMFYFSK